MIDWAASADPEVRRLLARHPRIATVEIGDSLGIEFRQNGRRREVRVGDADAEVFGLVELADNNPLVCADVASVPSPAATLALIGLGPLALSGLMVEPPVMVVNVPADEGDVSRFLSGAGWDDGLSIHVESEDLNGVGTAALMASIWTPDDPDDIAALYEERFGRSFFVRESDVASWDPVQVRGTYLAAYRLTLAVDTPHSLLTVRVLGDLNGKLGAGQVVHCLNVMYGFEESLGLQEF